MNNLNNPALRPRDIKRLVGSAMNRVVWDSGIEEKNEWVYASIESPETHKKLYEWLKSKERNPDEKAMRINPCWNKTEEITWADILQHPEKFFSDEGFQVVEVNCDWILTYQKEGIARFGLFEQN